MMEEYFETRESLKAVVLVTDLRHKPTSDDVQMFTYVKYLQLPIIVIGTKLDKVPKSKKDKHISIAKKTLQMEKEDLFIPFSSETGAGLEDMWSILNAYIH